MAAIKHIRSAEAQAHAAVSALNQAQVEATREGNHLTAMILSSELADAIALRDRLNRIKQAIEHTEAKTAAAATSEAGNGHWYYESDGPEHARTHYVWRYA